MLQKGVKTEYFLIYSKKWLIRKRKYEKEKGIQRNEFMGRFLISGGKGYQELLHFQPPAGGF